MSDPDDDTVDVPGIPWDDEPTVAGYELLFVSGRNPLGARIYKARHLSSGRIVAIRIVPAAGDFADRHWSLMQREAAILGSLEHPAIVQMIECGEQNGVRFLAYEYVDGGNLQEQMSRHPSQPRDAARLVERIARAVGHVHQRGIIHCDLKPSRIELTRDGLPKIADFYLARHLPVETDNEFPEDVIVGNLAYIAPEQARGILAELGPAVDIYGLGGILHALLTGRPPNPVNSARQLIERLLARETEPLRSLTSNVPRDLEAVTLKCLRRNPAERYPSAEALAEDLKRFVNGQTVAARPLGTIGRIFRWLTRPAFDE